jgi:VIT1/CCC1 family predicted Fe2+/Mn2+ transporter
MAKRTAIREHALPDASEPHETAGNSVLRPIVFGGNDGLVSNLALVMGVAGAGPAPSIIVLAGVAGLLAGAFSMAVGEFISVQSQRELLDYQVAFQHKQIREAADQERAILTRIYRERGFPEQETERIVEVIFEEPENAVRTMIFEEVGLDERSIGPRPSAPSSPSPSARSSRCCRTSSGRARWPSRCRWGSAWPRSPCSGSASVA